MKTELLFPRHVTHFFHIMAIMALFGYGVYHFFFGSVMLAVICCIGGLLGAASYFAIRSNNSYRHYQMGFISVAMIAATYTSFYFGIRGLTIVFPFVASMFYLFPPNKALRYSIIVIVINCAAAKSNTDIVVVVRFAVSMAVTLSFLYFFSAIAYAKQQALDKEASYDYLTKLPNRRRFHHWFSSALSQKKEGESAFLAVLDLNRFKRINDYYGYDFADRLIVMVAERLSSKIERLFPNDECKGVVNLARIAGDEFQIALVGSLSTECPAKIIDELTDVFAEPFELDRTQVKLFATIGGASSFSGCKHPSQFFAQAALALAKAKRDRKYQQDQNTSLVFNKQLQAELGQAHEIEKLLQRALLENGFYQVFMPVIDANSREVVGVEVLLRAQDKALLNYGPEKFIPVAEQTGLIVQIDLWVIENTFKQLAQINGIKPGMRVAINISAQQINNQHFPAQLKALIERYQVDTSQIELEITETALVDSAKVSANYFEKLKALGIKLALDDFGTGYTAFSQLSNYPVDTLKIDRSFIGAIEQSEQQRSMVDLVISIAQVYNLEIVAEGVESEAQLSYLRDKGCHLLQGFYLSKPLSFDDFVEFVGTSNQQRKAQPSKQL